MAAGEITFIQCPYGDSFPVQKTTSRSWEYSRSFGFARCGHGFEVSLEETVERISQGLNLLPTLAMRSA